MNLLGESCYLISALSDGIADVTVVSVRKAVFSICLLSTLGMQGIRCDASAHADSGLRQVRITRSNTRCSTLCPRSSICATCCL